MSQIIDKLNKVGKAAPQAMGFRAGGSKSPETKILLFAGLEYSGDPDLIAKYTSGADAVIIRMNKAELTSKSLKRISDSLPEIPWGIWLESAGTKKADSLAGCGCDFVVFPAETRVTAVPQGETLGKILQIETALGDFLLRSINDLPADAVYAPASYEGGAIEWRHLMLFQRVSNLLNKPLLVPVPAAITADELKTVWDTGVEGVVLEAGPEQADKLKELRKAIDEPTFKVSKKKSKADAVLPRMGSGESARAPEPDEEEEDDE
jgi:hypothetical protein